MILFVCEFIALLVRPIDSRNLNFLKVKAVETSLKIDKSHETICQIKFDSKNNIIQSRNMKEI